MKTEDIKLFQQVVESKSLVRAADVLDLAKSNISRRLKQLESEIGINLFRREARALILTEAGERFYSQSKSILAQLEQTISDITEPTLQLSGELKVQMVTNAHSLSFANAIFEFMALYPLVKVELITTTDELSLAQQHIDIAFVFTEQLQDSNLIARKINEAPLKLYASTDYFSATTLPKSIAELAGHNYIQPRLPSGHFFQKPLQAGFCPGKLNIVLTCNDINASVNACIAGIGLTVLTEHLGDQLVAQNKLIKILPSLEIYRCQSWIMYQSQQFMPATMRRCIDFTIEKLKQSNIKDEIKSTVNRFI